MLAEKLYKYSQENNNDLKNKFATSYNFGPSIESNKKVIELVEEISKYWSGLKVTNTIDNNFHEANRLNLQTDKSFHYLQWRPKWDF